MSIVKKIKISDRRTDREYLLSGKSKSEAGERNDNKKEMGEYQMPVYTYEVVGIDGDYAHLRRKRYRDGGNKAGSTGTAAAGDHGRLNPEI